MSAKLKVAVPSLVVLAVVILLLLQQREITRLRAENADLHGQLSQTESLQETNQHLAELLKAAGNSSEANQSELLRLRGQGVRLRQLEQENTQLKAQRQQLEQQMAEARLAVSAAQQRTATPPADAKATTTNPPPNTVELGELELQDGIAARFDLGGGTNCVVTPAALPDGNLSTKLVLSVTKPDGTASDLGEGRIAAQPGQHVSISVGDRMIALAVKLKSQ